jgi:putative transposase
MQTYKYKLYPSKKDKFLQKQLNTASWIFNHCIALHKRYYRLTGKFLSKYKLQKHITKLKKQQKYSLWNTLGSQVTQDITERIDRSYKLFFRNLKHNIKTDPPKFKKRIKYKSITFKQTGFKLLEDNKIKIQGKIFKYFKSREMQGNIKRLTVKKDPLGDFYLYIVTDNNAVQVSSQTGKSVGIDFGLKTFLSLSNNTSVESPLFFKQYMSQIQKANQELSKKKKGSQRRKKSKLKLSRLHKAIQNRRKDFFFKLSKKLTDTFDFICVEDLNIKSMQQRWGRKISDLSFHEFLNVLEYYCLKTDKKLIKVNRFFPSSQLCSRCGFQNKTLSLSDRTWTCPECQTVHDRDLNAAKNILEEGINILGGASPNREEFLRPALAG